jgi:hypothetical protein
LTEATRPEPGNDDDEAALDQSQSQSQLLDGAEPNHGDEQRRPPHLPGLFRRRQVGTATAHPRLSSLSTTAVELAEMGVKLTASETKRFVDMSMSKRRRGLGIFGELSLAPVVLNDLTAMRAT